MTRMPPSRQLAIAGAGDALQRYQRSVQAFDDAVGRRLGLGPSDLRCLDWLSSGPLTAGELSRAVGLRPAATTALVDRLERDGWVRRVRSEGDRRRVLVELTEDASAKVGAIYGPLAAEGPETFRGWTVAEIQRLVALLESMTAVTDAHRERL